MRALLFVLVLCQLLLPLTAAPAQNDGSLGWVAEAISKSNAANCPLEIVAHVVPKPQGYDLSFAMTNMTKRKLAFYRQHLPWGNVHAVRIAALTSDGELLNTGYPILDDFGVDKVELEPGQTLRGKYDLNWRWSPKSEPPTGFPPGKLIMLIWAYPLSAEELGGSSDAVCSGVTAFRTLN